MVFFPEMNGSGAMLSDRSITNQAKKTGGGTVLRIPPASSTISWRSRQRRIVRVALGAAAVKGIRIGFVVRAVDGDPFGQVGIGHVGAAESDGVGAAFGHQAFGVGRAQA